MLERTVRLVLLVPGQVDLAVGGDDRAVTFDEDLAVVAVADALGVRLGELGVAEAEADPESPGLVEQRSRRRARHRRFVVVVALGEVGDVPAREERRERQLREHDQLTASLGAVSQQGDQPLDHIGSAVLGLDGPELTATDDTVRVPIGPMIARLSILGHVRATYVHTWPHNPVAGRVGTRAGDG